MASIRPAADANLKRGKALLDLGKAAITAIRDGSEDSLDIIERSVTTFAEWEAGWKVSVRGGGDFSAKERDMGNRIAAQHSQVIRLVEGMRAEVDSSLKGLRQKGKGLKAYIDQLPQRISTIRTRKG
jgi:hypothetical protein